MTWPWPIKTQRCYRPNGQVRDEYLVLFGLPLGDFWFALVLTLGLAAVLALSACGPHFGYRDADCIGQWPTWICIAGG